MIILFFITITTIGYMITYQNLNFLNLRSIKWLQDCINYMNIAVWNYSIARKTKAKGISLYLRTRKGQKKLFLQPEQTNHPQLTDLFLASESSRSNCLLWHTSILHQYFNDLSGSYKINFQENFALTFYKFS